jgi:hypothetical protein
MKARIVALSSRTEPKVAAVAGLAVDGPEPDLDQVHPGR